jgi:DNA-damage-inducible protein D
MSEPELNLIFEGDEPPFEQQSRENGFTSWSGRKFAEILGYKDYKTFFASAINKAQQVCMSLEIDLAEHFKQETIIDENGSEVKDIRLSRFACYLAAMNGDPKKIEVAKAQAYFATFADVCRRYIQEAEQIERILIRDEISDHEKTLSSTAHKAGVVEYQFFQNAGYRGLYNMNLSALRKLKKIPTGRTLLDFMGKDELAANLFRITQTEAKIKREGIRGQTMLEKTAEDVGRTVRKTMHQISGQRPEQLPVAEDIKKLKSGLRATGAGLQKVDSKKLKQPKKEE